MRATDMSFVGSSGLRQAPARALTAVSAHASAPPIYLFDDLVCLQEYRLRNHDVLCLR